MNEQINVYMTGFTFINKNTNKIKKEMTALSSSLFIRMNE